VSAFVGECRIGTNEETSVRGEVILTTEGIDLNGGWCGRLYSDAFDFPAAERVAQSIVISLPSGSTGTVTVTHYTYLLPNQAHVTGVGPPPW
jgi:hypothetical protein